MRLDYKRHPLSEVCRDIPEKEFESLKYNILLNGVVRNTIFTLDGKILDGWHRYKAVKELTEEGMISLDVGLTYELSFIEYDGADPVRFVLSKNIHRRHLTVSQRSAIIVDAYKWFKRGQRNQMGPLGPFDSKTLAEMIKEAGVGESSIKRAKRLKKNALDLFNKVIDGDISLRAADDELSSRQEYERRLAVLERDAPDLSERVIDDDLSLDEAEQISEDRKNYNIRFSKLKNEDSELASRVESGELTIDDANQILTERRELETRINKLDSDLSEMVRSGEIDIDEAEYILEERKNLEARIALLASQAPDLSDKVDRGELTIDEAENQLTERKRVEEEQKSSADNQSAESGNDDSYPDDITEPGETPDMFGNEDSSESSDDNNGENDSETTQESRESDSSSSNTKYNEKESEDDSSEDSESDMRGEVDRNKLLREKLYQSIPRIYEVIEDDLSIEDANTLRNLYLKSTHSDKNNIDKSIDVPVTVKKYWNAIVFDCFQNLLNDIVEGVKFRKGVDDERKQSDSSFG